MAKDSQRLEQEFIATVAEKTGHDLAEWLEILKTVGSDKMNTLIKWLKEERKLNHSQAAFLAGIFLNDGKPVFDYEVLFERLFADKRHLLPIYHALESGIKTALPDVELVPTKTYISIEGKRCFACATPTSKLMRVGLDLGDMPFGEVVQKAKSLGAMPNISHMVEVSAPDQVNGQLVDYVRQAYKRTHS